MASRTLVLLGDSILDNAPYTEPKPDTTTHLTGLLAPDWQVDRLAVDGATMSAVPSQLARIQSRPAVAVLSIGGNDMTEHIGLLERTASTAAEILNELVSIADDFGKRYEVVARSVAAASDRTVLCTIYNVQLEPPFHARLARVPIALINDRIISVGALLGLDVLELRSVCTEADDFVLQIEPSPQGARKIAEAIAAVVQKDGRLKQAVVFAV